MTSIDEKRVYGDRGGATTVLVAAELGVASVEVSGDIVGEFSIAHRCVARDVAAADGRVAVATDEDVLDGSFEPLGFGPAVAVGFDGGGLLAAGEDGTLARYGDGWTELATLGEVRAIDADLVATDGGVHRVTDGGVRHVGLDDAHDVSVSGAPLAATGDGLYRLGNGWMDVMDGDFRVVGAEGDRALAATPDALFERADDGWRSAALPVSEPLSDVGFDEGDDGRYALTRPGTVLVTTGDGWRSRTLGLQGAAALAVRR